MSKGKSERAQTLWQGRWWLLPLLVGIGLIYALWSSAGRFGSGWPVYSAFFDLLAEGFRRGQLSLPIEPAPELLAAKNPYDRSNGRFWLIDATLHDRKWYLYWGPLPSLLQAIVKSLLQIHRIVGDQYLVLGFSLLSTWFGAQLIEDMRQRLFPRVPRWVSAFCILALAFGNPVMYLVGTAGQYQAAIAGGQTCLVGAAWCSFRAVQGLASPASRRRWLLLTGCGLGAALACRISLGAAAVAMAAMTAIAASWSSDRRWRSLLANAFYLGIAPALCGGALLLYNWLRFGQWLEFGMKEQVSYFEFKLSTRYFLTNLYSYALSPFELSCRFPYALQSMARGPKAVPAWVPLPKDYLLLEPISGFLYSAPITWLFPVPLLVAVRRLGAVHREAWRTYVFCALSFAVMGTITGGLVLFVYAATMRYLADFSYGLVLLSVLGAFTLITVLRSKLARGLAGGAVAALSCLTAVLGLLLGYQGYNEHFQNCNPALDARLVKALSVCR